MNHTRPQTQPPRTVTRRTALTGGLAAVALAAYPTSALADPPPGSGPRKPTPLPPGVDRATLMRWAQDTWASLVAMTDPGTGLVSDNITGDLSTPGVYTSPTNIGGYLWSAIVARDLRIITPGEASRRIRQTLRTLKRMEHHTASGMYFNWYDPRDGSVINEWPDNGDPVVPFVSSIDAAWLGAALLVVRNGDGANRRLAGEMFDRMRFDVFADPTFWKPYLMYGGFYLEEPTRLNNPATSGRATSSAPARRSGTRPATTTTPPRRRPGSPPTWRSPSGRCRTRPTTRCGGPSRRTGTGRS